MTRCPSCRQNDAIDQRRTYHERRDAEQCVRCWREAEPGRSRCAIHLEQARLRSEMDRLKKQQDHHSDTRQLELV